MNASSDPPSPAQQGAGDVLEKVLSFRLGAEEYGVDVLKVQEIKGWDAVTRVPYSPPWVLGVINLRGAIVPVIDLRVRFSFAQAPFDSTTVIIVVRVPGARGERTVGVVVDAVTEVYDLAKSEIRPPPDLGGGAQAAFLQGIADRDEKLVMLLDIDRLVNSSITAEAGGGRRAAA